MTPEEMRNDLTRSGLNLIGQALSIFDSDLRLAVANRQYQAMFDLPDELVQIGTAFEATIRYLVHRGEYGPQDDPEDAVASRVAQARTFEPHYFERQRANGRWIGVEGAPLGQGGWITVYTDITQSKRQEALLRARSEELSGQVLDHAELLASANRELAATNAALKEAQSVLTQVEARTRQVTEMIPAHIAHLDAQYRYTFSNRQQPYIFPGSTGNVIGSTVAETLGEDTFQTLRPRIDNALAGEAQVFEMTHRPSGRRVRIALTPDRLGQGVYVLSTDVSSEVQAREAIVHAAKRSLAARLTSGLAHDFGNLLTIILGLQGRISGQGLPEPILADVQSTLAAARRGANLLERLSKISGPRDLAVEPVQLAPLLAEVVQLAEPSLKQSVNINLQTRISDKPVLLDPGALQDSLLNLILNANSAIIAPGTITLSAQTGGAWIEISVADTGPGFSREALIRATEPFYTSKSGQGSGLGLSMVYDQTKLLGGTMRLENSPTGAKVTLRLPLHYVTRQMLLLVEDDDAVRAEVRTQLTSLGHAVIEAASLSEARAMTDIPGLTMILSDIQLGDGLGLELSGQGLPVAFMTALPRKNALRNHARGPVLTKPFTSAKLAGVIAAAVQASQ